MSKKHTFTTADYLPWDTMLVLVRRLYKDGNYRMSLLIACGSFFGLRISDLLSLTWEQVLGKSFSLNEKKTGKHREIKVNEGLLPSLRCASPQGEMLFEQVRRSYLHTED